MWHASVAVQRGDRGAVKFKNLRHSVIVYGKSLVGSLLYGVGVISQRIVFVTDPSGYAIHCQKPLTLNEIHQLPMGWLEIPASDHLGPIRMI